MLIYTLDSIANIVIPITTIIILYNLMVETIATLFRVSVSSI